MLINKTDFALVIKNAARAVDFKTNTFDGLILESVSRDSIRILATDRFIINELTINGVQDVDLGFTTALPGQLLLDWTKSVRSNSSETVFFDEDNHLLKDDNYTILLPEPVNTPTALDRFFEPNPPELLAEPNNPSEAVFTLLKTKIKALPDAALDGLIDFYILKPGFIGFSGWLNDHISWRSVIKSFTRKENSIWEGNE